MLVPPYQPPFTLRTGWAMTYFTAQRGLQQWQTWTGLSPVSLQKHIWKGEAKVPLAGGWAMGTKGTLIATYGITGSLSNQWVLQMILAKAAKAGLAVVGFDWRAHGQSALLSPALTSDGLLEGHDFLWIAAQAKALGCPPPYWFAGYSLGGQLALWASYYAQYPARYGLEPADIGGVVAICPSLDADRSLSYLSRSRLGRYVDGRITSELQKLGEVLVSMHPEIHSRSALEKATSIRTFDQYLVIPELGFASTAAYYAASSPLPWLQTLQTPTLILYAADDPLFDPSIAPDLIDACRDNPAITLLLTPQGGHVGYLCDRETQAFCGDPDWCWAGNRLVDWCGGSLG